MGAFGLRLLSFSSDASHRVPRQTFLNIDHWHNHDDDDGNGLQVPSRAGPTVAMVHNRFNERETNPNPHINFITPLPMPGAESPYSEVDARQLLRALAAQVRPIMKNHGFAVNSFEEVCPSAVAW